MIIIRIDVLLTDDVVYAFSLTDQQSRQMRTNALDLSVKAIALVVLSFCPAAVMSGEPPESVDIGTTLMALATKAQAIEDEYLVALDVFTAFPLRDGQLSMLIEATASPDAMGSSTPMPGGYGDLDSTFMYGDRSDAQLTELHYGIETRSGVWTIGLLDSASHIDISTVANDEKTQFMNPDFVNNPTIDMPDSSLGLSYHHPYGATGPGYSLLLIADRDILEERAAPAADTVGNYGRTGVFMGVEAHWNIGLANASLGTWGNIGKNPPTDSEWGSGRNYGFYTSIDGSHLGVHWNIRAGMARFQDSVSESFLSVAAELPVSDHVLGIAAGRVMHGGRLKSDLPGDTSRVELYYRFTVFDGFVITPDIQFVTAGRSNSPNGLVTACIRFRLNF